MRLFQLMILKTSVLFFGLVLVLGVFFVGTTLALNPNQPFLLFKPLFKPFPAPTSLEGGTGTVTAGKTLHQQGLTEQSYIDQGIAYLKKKLGDDYYQKYIVVDKQASFTYQVCDANNKCQTNHTVSFKQNIPLDHVYSTSGPVASNLLVQINLSLDDFGTVSNYVGPEKNYKFNLTKSVILSKALAFGINNPSQAGIAGVKESEDGYEIVWRVENDEDGVMLDPDTGELKEKYKAYHCTVCPICLSSNTRIDTPVGQLNVKDLQIGMLVYSVNDSGQKIISKIIKVSNTQVGVAHQVIDLRLSDGRELWLSPGHTLINGKKAADLKIYDTYNGAIVIGNNLISYWDNKTYDLLPDSRTGYYFANGILVGSTLK